jgi:hypothetical protein
MNLKIRLIAVILGCFALFSLSWLASPSALAQEPQPRPPLPPSSGGSGNGGGGNHGSGDNDTVTTSRRGRVSGFVYSYSDRAYIGGVKVIIDGGGWQAETLTDSRGYYQFGGLGAGRGVINLQLPPGASPVVFDWPVQLGGGADLRVDLGYYWQDSATLPIIMSGHIASQGLHLEIKNQTRAKISAGMVEINTPVDLQLAPGVSASQGEMMDYSPYRLRFAVGVIEPASVVSLIIPLEKIGSLSVEPNEANIRVAFTYAEQITPILINVRSDQAENDLPMPQIAATSTPSSPTLPSLNAPVSTAPTLIPALPRTGENQHSTSLTEIILPLLFILGLSLRGWSSLWKANTPSSE